MEAAALFTVGAMRGVDTGCLLTVSDIVVEGEFTRISDEGLRAAVDRMTRLALDVATLRSPATTVFLVNPASANGAHGTALARAGPSCSPALDSSGEDALLPSGPAT